MKTAIFHHIVKKCVFVMNQKHVFGYRFLVTNRNVFEGHENTPLIRYARYVTKIGAMRYASPEKFYFFRQQCGNMSVIVNTFSNKHEWHTFT